MIHHVWNSIWQHVIHRGLMQMKPVTAAHRKTEAVLREMNLWKHHCCWARRNDLSWYDNILAGAVNSARWKGPVTTVRMSGGINTLFNQHFLIYKVIYIAHWVKSKPLANKCHLLFVDSKGTRGEVGNNFGVKHTLKWVGNHVEQ